MTRSQWVGLLMMFACACRGAPIGGEGQNPGDCSDDADNDLDGLFDCADPGCSGAVVCGTVRDGSVIDVSVDRALVDRGLSDQTSSGRPPQILNFATNVSDVRWNQSVRFTAIVTDPDGIDDLIGGQLLDADSSLGSLLHCGSGGRISNRSQRNTAHVGQSGSVELPLCRAFLRPTRH